jgi:hypothetical protein
MLQRSIIKSRSLAAANIIYEEEMLAPQPTLFANDIGMDGIAPTERRGLGLPLVFLRLFSYGEF